MDAQAPRDPDTRRGRRDTPKHRGLTVLRLVTLAACLAFALMLATAPPREAPRVGAIGSGCSYELDTWTGTLTIRPTDGVSGEMARVRDALPDDLRHAVRSVSVERGVLAPADSGYLFWGLDAAEALDLSGWDTSQVTDMGWMFCNCSSLASLDLSHFDTSRVTRMGSVYVGGMFSGCSSLASLDLSGWDTSKVEGMWGMFSGCSSLASLDLSGWDTSRVEDMGGMFSGCASLPSLDLSGWDTSGVEGMWGMFAGCASLSSLAVGEGCGDVLSADMHTALPAGVGGWGWHSERDERWLTTGELSSSRQGVADTYTAPEAWRSLVSPQAAQASP